MKMPRHAYSNAWNVGVRTAFLGGKGSEARLRHFVVRAFALSRYKRYSTLPRLLSRVGDKPLKYRVACFPNGTALLKRSRHKEAFVEGKLP